MKLNDVLAVMKGIFVKHKNKTLAIVAGVLVAGVVGAQSFPLSTTPLASTVINCSVAGSCNIVVAAPEMPKMEGVEQFGANGTLADGITRWTSGNFTEDLDVDDELNVDASSTFTGYVSSTRVARALGDGYSSVATSQTLCAYRNTGALDRVLTDVTLGYATDTVTGGGVQQFTISLSATQGATGTGSNLLFNSTDIAVPTNGLLNFTTTSTLQGTGAVRAIWRKGDYLNFLIASPTTTFQGDCRAIYY